MKPPRTVVLLLALFAGGPAFAQAAASASNLALAALREGGAVALIRHANAPGTGDPPSFRLGDCATQRNLGPAGRAQAAALGHRLLAEGVVVAEVRSSRWCRGLDTAALAFPDRPAIPDPALDSFFDARASGPGQTEQLKGLIAGWQGRPGVLVLITHQVNITALTRIVPAEGEIVVVRPGGGAFEVVGRVLP